MLSTIIQHAWISVKEPKIGAQLILRLSPSRRTLLEMAALVVVLNVFLTQAFALIAPTPSGASFLTALEAPLPSLALHTLLLFMIVIMTFGVGRLMGGCGSLDATILIVIWLQYLMLVANFLQIVLALFWSPLGLAIAMLSSVLFIWLFVNFVMVLHGFKSIMKVLIASIASFFVTIFLIAASVSVFGFLL